MKWMSALFSVFIFSSILHAQEETGTMEIVQITSAALEDNLIDDSGRKTLMVYLPPSYESSDKSYPVIYWLGGYTVDFSKPFWRSFLRRDFFLDPINEAIQSGESGEIIVVAIDGFNRFGGSYFVSSPTTGDWETYITRDVVNFIDSEYRTIPHRDSRGIDGNSMGGFGAMHIGLSYPDIFSAAMAQSGLYDMSADWGTNQQTWAVGTPAFVDPPSFFSLNNLEDEVKEWFALAAALAPNPDNPPFFLDKPFELVDGEARIISGIQQRMVEGDVIRDLEHYVGQTTRLNGIKIVHGSADDVVPVEQARTLVGRLSELGIPHVYEEILGGGHDLDIQISMAFFTEMLSVESPTSVSAETWGGVKAQMK